MCLSKEGYDKYEPQLPPIDPNLWPNKNTSKNPVILLDERSILEEKKADTSFWARQDELLKQQAGPEIQLESIDE